MPTELHAAARLTERLEALYPYEIFGTPPEASFDRIVQMVAGLFGTEAVHINFLDDCVQVSKAFWGTDASGISLQDSLCAQAILQDDVFVVLDAPNDPRFCDNPLVTAGKIGFYVSAVLKSAEGVNIGTLCLTDPQPKDVFSDRDRTLLANFAALVMDELELRSSLQALARTRAELQRAHTALAERMAQLQCTSSALERLNEQLHHDAHHDPLTGLPNRAYFLGALAQTLYEETQPFALLFLDFDRFKLINDSLGHAVGDEVLRALTHRLRHQLKASDTLARFGGDEFCVLLPRVTAAEAVTTAERLRGHFCHPVRLHGKNLRLGVSIGVVSSKGQQRGAEALLQDADIAMYRAKAQGKGGNQGAVAFFEASMREGIVAQLSLEDELRETIKNEGLSVAYQPIFDSAGQLTGVEALARWPHRERGSVPPAEFIPVAEDSGLIIPLERFVLSEAVAQVAAWNRPGTPLSLSVNLSSPHFSCPELVPFVTDLLKASGLAPERLVLALTESTLLENSDALVQTLTKLKALGVRLALDDFGTGYSSLSYLQRVPLDLLKIDRAFVQQMSCTRKGAELVKTIIAMARTLELTVVAEGVETEAQRRTLIALGCPYLQGFLLARPLPAADAEAMIQAHRGKAREVVRV